MNDDSDAAAAYQVIINVLAVRRRAWRALVIGLLLAILGGVVSLATYADAEQQATQTGEGHYYVLWGVMAYGLYKATRAVWVLFRIHRALRRGAS